MTHHPHDVSQLVHVLAASVGGSVVMLGLLRISRWAEARQRRSHRLAKELAFHEAHQRPEARVMSGAVHRPERRSLRLVEGERK